MKTKMALAGCLMAAVLLLQSGCAVLLVGGAAAAGAGTYAYVKGELKSVEAAPLDRVWTGTQGAVKELEFPVISQAKDNLSAKMVARTAQDKKIHIDLRKVSDNTTEVRIRVGTFGDERISRLILDKIRKGTY